MSWIGIYLTCAKAKEKSQAACGTWHHFCGLFTAAPSSPPHWLAEGLWATHLTTNWWRECGHMMVSCWRDPRSCHGEVGKGRSGYCRVYYPTHTPPLGRGSYNAQNGRQETKTCCSSECDKRQRDVVQVSVQNEFKNGTETLAMTWVDFSKEVFKNHLLVCAAGVETLTELPGGLD